MLLEEASQEDAAPVTELLLVRLISEGLEIVVGSLVDEEEEQAQEFAVDAGRFTCSIPACTRSGGGLLGKSAHWRHSRKVSTNIS